MKKLHLLIVAAAMCFAGTATAGPPERATINIVNSSRFGDTIIFFENLTYACDGHSSTSMTAADNVMSEASVALMTKVALAAMLSGREVDVAGEWDPNVAGGTCILRSISLR